MNAKTIKLLLSVLVVLGIAVVIQRSVPQRDVYETEVESLAVQLNAPAIDRVVIQRGRDAAAQIALQREADVWRVPTRWNVRADAENITQLFAVVRDLSGELRSTDEMLLADYGITDDVGIHVTLFEGDREAVHIILGTQAVGWRQQFVRRDGSTSVFLTDASITSLLGLYGDVATGELSVDGWLDLRPIDVDAASISQVEVQEQGAPWRVLGDNLPFTRDEAKWQSYIQTIIQMRAQQVVEPNGDYGLNTPRWQIRLSGEDAHLALLTISAVKAEDDTTTHYLTTSQESTVYVVPEYAMKQLLPDGRRFISTNPLGVDRETVAGVTLSTPEVQRSVVMPDDSWEGLNTYIDELARMTIAQVDNVEAPSTTPYQLTVQYRSDQPALTIACGGIGEDADETTCVNPQAARAFQISRHVFDSMFGNLDRLVRPAPQESNTPTAGHDATSDILKPTS